MYLIPMSWIHGFFRRDFWNRLPGEIHLYPPKGFGYRLRIQWSHEHDETWRKSASSERYSVDGKGRVVRAPHTRQELTPSSSKQANPGILGDDGGDDNERDDINRAMGSGRKPRYSQASSDYSVEPKGISYWPNTSSSSEAE